MKIFHTLTTLFLLFPLALSLPVHTPRFRSCTSSCSACLPLTSTSSICIPSRNTILSHTLRQEESTPTGGLTGDPCTANTDCSSGRGCGRLQNDGSIATCSNPDDACFCFPTDFKICDASGECIPGEVCAQEAEGNVQLCVAKTSPLLEEAKEEEEERVVDVDAAATGDKDLPTNPPVTTIPQGPAVPPAPQVTPQPEQETTPVATAAVTTPTAVPVDETPTETAVPSAGPAVPAGSEEPSAVVPPVVPPVDSSESESTTDTEGETETSTETGVETESETETTTEGEEGTVPADTTDAEAESSDEETTETGVTGIPSETVEADEEEESEDPSVTGEDDGSIDGAADDESSEDGEDDDDDEDEVCIGVHHLEGVKSLVYDTHRKAKVLCDSMGSCATPGHIVHWKGRSMMMATYCDLLEEDCVSKSMMVNSPTWQRGLRVGSLTTGLEFTAFAARYGTRAEERLLTAAVRIGL